MKPNQLKGWKLLQKSVDESLDAAEQETFNQYKQSDEGQAFVELHSELMNELPHQQPDISMNQRELRQIAQKIGQQVQQKRRKRQVFVVARGFALVTAVFLVAFVGLGWLANNTFSPEPAAISVIEPTTVPFPTPPLAANAVYVDLLHDSPQSVEKLSAIYYAQTIAAAAEQITYTLMLPNQLNETLSYVGAMVNPDNEAFEIAFISNNLYHQKGPSLWILSQRPVRSGEENHPLSTTYLPFEDVDKNTLEITLHTKESAEVNGAKAVYDAIEYYFASGFSDTIAKPSDWQMVNRLYWQADGRQYTLTFIATPVLYHSTMESMAEGFYLLPHTP